MTRKAAKTEKKTEGVHAASQTELPAPRYEEIRLCAISTGLNIRTSFDDEGIEELSRSIALHGILEPLIVTEKAEGSGEYLLVAGERRYRAAQVLSLESAPCQIYPALNSEQVLQIMFAENLQRRDLNPVEEAEGLRRMLDLGMTQSKLGGLLGRSQEWVSNRLRLLDLPQCILDRIISQGITPAHALVVLSFKDSPRFDDYCQYVCGKADSGKMPTVPETKNTYLSWVYSLGGSEARHGLRGFLSEQQLREHCSVCPYHYNDVCFDPSCYEELSKERYENVRNAEDSGNIIFPEEGSYKLRENPLRPEACAGCSHLSQAGGVTVCGDAECYCRKNEIIRHSRNELSVQLKSAIIEDLRDRISDDGAVAVFLRSGMNSFGGYNFYHSDLGNDPGASDILLELIVFEMYRGMCIDWSSDPQRIVDSYEKTMREFGFEPSQLLPRGEEPVSQTEEASA